jgi:3-phenylpropionate/cinnamic acid dioxygenase small subunit
MTETIPDTGAFVTPACYVTVQQFYAWQMGLLDDGQSDAWADTFTTDAVFAEPGLPEPLHGREAIRASVRERTARLRRERLTQRHWFAMLTVTETADGVNTRNYALAVATPQGGELAIRGHAVCLDELVAHGGSWLVRRRTIRPDNRAGQPV